MVLTEVGSESSTSLEAVHCSRGDIHRGTQGKVRYLKWVLWYRRDIFALCSFVFHDVNYYLGVHVFLFVNLLSQIVVSSALTLAVILDIVTNPCACQIQWHLPVVLSCRCPLFVTLSLVSKTSPSPSFWPLLFVLIVDFIYLHSSQMLYSLRFSPYPCFTYLYYQSLGNICYGHKWLSLFILSM